MKRLFVLLLLIFSFGIFLNSNAEASHSYYESHYCIKKKGDDGKWPFYSSTYWKCPKKFKKVSKYEYEKFKKIIDEKYVPKGLVSKSPKKAINTKSSWNGTYTWRGQKVSKDVYCTNADKNKMRVYHPEEFELKCSGYGKLTFREIKKKEAEANKIKTQASNEWITKKNNKFDKITEIENMFSEGFLSKSECEQAKSKILNTSEKGITSCDNIKVYTAKKKSDEKTDVAKIEETKKEEYIRIKGKGSFEIVFNGYFVNLAGNPKEDTKWRVDMAKEASCIQAKNNAFHQALKNTKGDTVGAKSTIMLAGIKDVKETFKKNTLRNTSQKTVKIIKCDIEVVFTITGPALDYFKNNKKIKDKAIAKIEEPKQEEFKPETKDVDNDAPIIEIAKNITVDSQAYTLKGKVKDKSQIYLTIDGRQVQVKKGKFELERFNIDPDVAEEIKIVAIDKWNNRAEKTIKVTIDLQSTDTAKVYEDLNPNNVKVKTDKNKIAIIIGIEKYENLTNLDAKYANRDAKAFRAYATRALGIKPSNLKILIDDKATRSQVLKAFKLWLPKIAGDGGKDIHLFFAGHGLASDNGEDLYILPQDGESSLLEDTAISRVELISLINKVSPRSVTMFFDTCYSGQTRDERMLVASLRPIRIVADEQDTPTNFTIFTASNYDQTSGSIEEAKHGMFSYYLMKGLEGKADENEDKKITNGELIAYLKDSVSQEAFTQNRQQDPMLAGDPDKVLMSY